MMSSIISEIMRALMSLIDTTMIIAVNLMQKIDLLICRCYPAHLTPKDDYVRINIFLTGFRDGFLSLGRIFSPARSEPMDTDIGKYWRRIDQYLERAMDKEEVYDLLVRVHTPSESELRHFFYEHRDAPDKYQLLAELLKERLQKEQKDRTADDDPKAPEDHGSRLSRLSARSTIQ